MELGCTGVYIYFHIFALKHRSFQPEKVIFTEAARVDKSFYYIQSSEIQENIDEILYISDIFTCEDIKSYIFTCEDITFWITSDFSFDLLQYTSELQTFITSLYVNENIKCGYSFS